MMMKQAIGFVAQAVAGLLPLMLFAGVAGIDKPAQARGQASFPTPKPPKTEGEKAVYQIYQQSQEADRLFSQHKYAEAAAIYESSLNALNKTFKREPALAGYLLPVRKNELTMARKYFHEADNLLKQDAMSALTLTGVWSTMLTHSLEIAGGKAPEGVFVATDANIISFAYRDIHAVELPVPDDKWADVVDKLELAQAKLTAVVNRHPEYQTETIDRSVYPDVTGEKALAEVKQKLAESRAELEKAGPRLQKAVPEGVQHDLDMVTQQIDKMIGQAQAGEFLEAREADMMIGNRAQYLKQLSQRLQSDYQQEGKTLSPDALKPVLAKLDALQAAVDAHAAQNSFPTGQPHDETLEASIRRQIARNTPQARVLKTAMMDAGWEILKNDLGIPTMRRKEGYVLYKLPNEKWARLYRVTYYENYAGGGTYAKANGADTYGFVRWQKAEGAAGGASAGKH